MAKTEHVQDRTRDEMIVLTSMASLNFSDYKSQKEMEKALLVRITTARRLVNPKTVAMRMLECVAIPATVVGLEWHEPSHRYIVTYKPDKVHENNDDIEHVRSDQTTNPYAVDDVKSMWEAALNKHVIVYKMLEETGDSKKPEVRVSPYVQILPN